MKPAWEWTEADLDALIANGVKESIELDYKKSEALGKTDGKKNEISKDVSAFANSAGGALVYGIEENGNIPTSVDAGIDPSDITKEWLDQVINSRIQRRIDGVRINQIALSSNRPGRVAYVVSIPQSMRAPHQAADKKFYKRFNFESVPMDEYEIRDVARRNESPDLIATLSFYEEQPIRLHFEKDTDFSKGVPLSFLVENTASMPATYVIFFLLVDSRIHVRKAGDFSILPEINATMGAKTFNLNRFQLNHVVPGKMPIFEGVHFQMNQKPIELGFPRMSDKFLCGWQIRLPGATPKHKWLMIDSDGTFARFIDPPPTVPIETLFGVSFVSIGR
ncbi:MAG: ATP-binding protein [Gemmataceae bacterium]|nr:ATP-binding protein [Gemmataceae bacterium]